MSLYYLSPTATFWAHMSSMFDTDKTPAANLTADWTETDDGTLVLSVPVPGFDKSNVSVRLQNTARPTDEWILGVSAKNATSERSLAVYLPWKARHNTYNATGVTAVCKNGLLTVTVPRAQTAAPSQIDVAVTGD